MSGLSLNLGEEQMRAIVAEAIVAKLDDAARKQLIEDAVGKVLTPEKQGYGYGAKEQSPLEVAFQQAVRRLTFEVAEEYIASHPEIRQRIEEALGAALVKLTQQDYGIRDAIASAVSSALEKKLSE